jgi:hypothetical protein
MAEFEFWIAKIPVPSHCGMRIVDGGTLCRVAAKVLMRGCDSSQAEKYRCSSVVTVQRDNCCICRGAPMNSSSMFVASQIIYRLDHFQLVLDAVRVIDEFDDGLLLSLSIERLPSSELVGEEARWK